MEFEHTKERDAYIGAQGKVILNACPGSGKTTTVAYKLNQLMKDWETTHGKYLGIACLSFTNVAKDEINDKFADFCGHAIRFPHIVSTIDSFVNQYITLPFYYLFEKAFKERPKIIENPAFMDQWFFPFHHIVPKKDGSTSRKPIQYSYPPSKIDINVDGSYSYEGKKASLMGADIDIYNQYCKAIKKRQFSNGLLKNSDSTYIALKILQEKPIVAKMLAYRFPYVIVDEAQDTSETQYAILDELIKNGLDNIDLVGDPYQSLYEWREARPDLFMKRLESAEWQPLKFNECRRSTKVIVDCYSSLRRVCDLDLESRHKVPEPEPVRVLVYSDVERLIKKYKELSTRHTKCKILVRGGTLLDRLGAKTSHEIMWKIEPCVPYQLILAKNDRKNGRAKDCVRRIRRCLPILTDPTFDDNKQASWLEENGKKPEWNARTLELVAGLPSFELLLSEWTRLTQEWCREALNLDHTPDFELKKGNKSPLHTKKMNDLYKEAPNGELVCTIHAVKGKTFDSIMLVLSENSLGQNISLDNFNRSTDLPDEKKRIVYVAISRPREQLVVAIPQNAGFTEAQIKERLGEVIDIEVV
jgi:DNA helicase II / ATP-dependent DNA helicase PcrA